MKSLLTRLILWALPIDWHELHAGVAVLMQERGVWRDRISGSEKELGNRIVDLSVRLVDQAAALKACASELQELREKLAAQPAEPAPTSRRATNWGEFRAAAEVSARKKR